VRTRSALRVFIREVLGVRSSLVAASPRSRRSRVGSIHHKRGNGVRFPVDWRLPTDLQVGRPALTAGHPYWQANTPITT